MSPDARDRLHAVTDRLPPPSSRLRASPDRSNIRVLVIIGVIAAAVAAGYLWLARPRPGPTAPLPTATVAHTRPTAPLNPAASSSVVVHVLGKVKHPGVVTLPSGSRVAEAIKAAGGVRPGTQTGPLNLARKLVDGEQIPVGVTRPTPTPAPGPVPSPPNDPGAPLDLNTATVDQLDDLPGVGPVLAQRIVDFRAQHGRFRSVEQLQDVSGIGARRFADLKPKVRV
ncbi:competence protein ComEA [Actinomadura pelletieri DSM 43383]|uniref:Competence protein ComEA n=1 Tax=Actinomadura pelletieri DSM 43383 TaxID=1120940 RepID=A0A495QPJ4_9ACTN|nr:ComEA family DNA-binding protein [Actinomadura pelletieri]RKS74861.1 competence protein ComEA [Actinomadura pelletieri DSM 43383]